MKKSYIFLDVGLFFLIFLLFIFVLILDFETKELVSANNLEIQRHEELINDLKNEVIDLKSEIDLLRFSIEVSCTAYSPRQIETDDTPFITAFNTKVKPWTVAVSRDLFESGFVAGRKIKIDGIGGYSGVYVVNDLMNERKKRHVDIFFFDTKEALNFGHKKIKITLLEI